MSFKRLTESELFLADGFAVEGENGSPVLGEHIRACYAEIERLTAENSLLRDANEGAMHDGMAKTEETRQVMLELEKAKAENAELKHQIEVEAMQTSDRINDLQSENAELKEKLKYRQTIEDEP